MKKILLNIISIVLLCALTMNAKAQWIEETTFNSPINDLIEFNGDLFVLGSFTQREGNTCYWSSKYDGSNFENNTTSSAGSSLYEGAVFNSTLYGVGGLTNTTFGGSGVSTWGGSSWFTGSSFSSSHSGILVDGSTLYVGSGFGVVSSTTGAGYTSLPTLEGFSESVSCLEKYSGNLIAGGRFTSYNGTNLNHITEWDGTTWQPLGSGFTGTSNPEVMTLAFYNGELYAGGNFITAGGINAKYIAKWDGTNWSSVGNNVTSGGGNGVRDMVVHNGKLYIAGDFSEIGGVLTNDIAVWDGTNWSAIDLVSTSNFANCLTIYNNRLYAGTHDFSTSQLFSIDLNSILNSFAVNGQISDSESNPLTNSWVYWTQISNLDSSIIFVDSTMTTSTGSFSFSGSLSDGYLKVIPDENLYPDEIPTYYGTSSTIQGATLITTDISPISFSTLGGIGVSTSSGLIAGFIGVGSSKNNAVGDPISNLDLILVNETNQIVVNTVTNGSGEFSFDNLDNGEYKIWVDYPLINNSIAPEFVLNVDDNQKDNLQFGLNKTSLELLNPTSVKENNFARLSIFPNPCFSSLNISFDTSNKLEMEIYSINGKEIMTKIVSSDETISVEAFNSGIYFVKFSDKDKLVAIEKFIIK